MDPLCPVVIVLTCHPPTTWFNARTEARMRLIVEYVSNQEIADAVVVAAQSAVS